MVYKIRILILCLIIFILSFLAFFSKGNVETNLLKTLLPQNVENSSEIISITNKTSSLIKVVFESDEEVVVEKLSNDFINQIDNNYFEINEIDILSLLNNYSISPTNFLSDKTRELLKEKNYDEIYSKGLNSLYNPVGIQFITFDKDPYFLFEDFILSNKKITGTNYFDGKYYKALSLKIKNDSGLSPDLSNKKISQLVKLQQKFSKENSKIYLAGTPIHSYHTSQKSIININIICILSTILVMGLTYFYFRNLKLLFPILLSILFGMLSGFVATKLWFNDFQIITMVFSTTLIGIGIDYSYHYFFANKIDKTFIKNLSFSFISTVIPFILLYLTKIELLKQISIFTIFGLAGIYFIVLFIYPCFSFEKSQKQIKINEKIYKVIFCILCLFSLMGIFRFNFNDTLSALYSPSLKLQKAENLYNKVSGNIVQNTQIIVVKGNNLKEILKKEENITDELIKNNIEYFSLSKFIPSENRQKENFELVKNLYVKNLNNYSDILTLMQIEKLKKEKFNPVSFEIANYSYFNDFMLNSGTSMIFAVTDKKIDFLKVDTKIIDFQKDIGKYMKDYREKLLLMLPVAIILLLGLLTILYDFKKAVKIIIPSVLGILFGGCLVSFIFGEINFFVVITTFLIIGFTIDYSIFRVNSENKTEDAILVSCLTTSFSFLLLALSGFKMLSSMALTLFFGIIISYFVGYFICSEKKKNNSVIE